MFDKADFNTLRHTQPQWVIDKLVEQTTKQGAEIHRLKNEVERLSTDVMHLEGQLATQNEDDQTEFFA